VRKKATATVKKIFQNAEVFIFFGQISPDYLTGVSLIAGLPSTDFLPAARQAKIEKKATR